MINKSQKKKQLLFLLDDICKKQQEIDQCRMYYRSLEQQIETKREKVFNLEDRETCTREIAALNQEFNQKIDGLYERLNQSLLHGRDLASVIDKEIHRDFRLLWDYMTQASKQEIQTERVLQDIDCIKKDLTT